MLVGVINFYNEIQFLERCLRSLKGKVDFIIAVDGSYKSFPHDKPWSTDGSIDIAKRYCDEVIETKTAWQDQIEKRNAYLKGNDGDWYLMLDADEELVGKPKNYETEEDWEIMLYRTDGMGKYPVYRLFKHREGIKYYGTHHCLVVNNELLNKRDMKVAEGCRIMHFTTERNFERVRDKSIYYQGRTEEMEFRRANNLLC